MNAKTDTGDGHQSSDEERDRDAPKIEVEHLYKLFGGGRDEAMSRLEKGESKEKVNRETGTVVAVHDVSFTLQEGEIFVVMGLSGSGKSTLIRCINRLIEPSSGVVRIDGEDIQSVDDNRLRKIRLTKMAMVFQHFALFPHRTVGQNVEYGLKIQDVDQDERRERALKALDLVGLKDWADRPPENLSGGMQQRVGLARALAVDPELLLMDEPFSALDPLIRADMQEELLELQRDFKNSIVFITHDLNEALRLGDRIAIMKDGRFVQVGSPEEIVARPADDYVRAFTQDVDRGRVFRVDTVMKPAEALRAGVSSLEDAEQRMGELDRDALYLVGGEDEPAGVVTARSAARARADGDGELDGATLRDFPTARRSELLVAVFERCAAGLPLAVVDKSGKLRGALHPHDVFAALAGSDPGPDEDPGSEERAAAADAGDAPADDDASEGDDGEPAHATAEH